MMLDLIFFMKEKYYRIRVNIMDFEFGQTGGQILLYNLVAV